MTRRTRVPISDILINLRFFTLLGAQMGWGGMCHDAVVCLDGLAESTYI
jgi:hypothetical protein